MRTFGARSDLEDLLSDELIQSMMKADKVDPASIRLLFSTLACQNEPETASAITRAWRNVRCCVIDLLRHSAGFESTRLHCSQSSPHGNDDHIFAARHHGGVTRKSPFCS